MSDENGPVEGFAYIVGEVTSPTRPHAPSRAAPKLPSHAPPKPGGLSAASPPPAASPFLITGVSSSAAPTHAPPAAPTSISSRDPVQMQALRDALAKAEEAVKMAKMAKQDAERAAEKERRERAQAYEARIAAQHEKMEALAAAEEAKRINSENQRRTLEEQARIAIEKAMQSRAALKASSLTQVEHDAKKDEELHRLELEAKFVAQGMSGAQATAAAAAQLAAAGSVSGRPRSSTPTTLLAAAPGGPTPSPATATVSSSSSSSSSSSLSSSTSALAAVVSDSALPSSSSAVAQPTTTSTTSASATHAPRRISDGKPPTPRRSSGSATASAHSHKHSGSGGASGAMSVNIPASPAHAGAHGAHIPPASPGGKMLRGARPGLLSLPEGGGGVDNAGSGDDMAVPGTPRDFSSEKCIKDGYLFKLGGQVKNWKRRYFRLINGFLVYFKHKDWQKLEPLGMIAVKAAKIVTFAPGVYDRDHLFGIAPATTKRTYVLGAKSDGERGEWLDALDPLIGPRADEKKKLRGGDKHNPLIKEGFLRQWNGTEWLENFFILTATSLKAYAETFAGPKLVDDIPLAAGTVVAMEPTTHEQDTCFSVSPFQRPKLLLACIDEAVRGNWMEAFNDALRISSHTSTSERRGSIRIAPYSDRYEYSESDSEKAEDMSLDSSDEEHPEDLASPLRVHAANEGGNEMGSPTNSSSSVSLGGVEEEGGKHTPLVEKRSGSVSRPSPLALSSPSPSHATLSHNTLSASSTASSNSSISPSSSLSGEKRLVPSASQQQHHEPTKSDEKQEYSTGTVGRRGSKIRDIFKGDEIIFKQGSVLKLNSKFEIGVHKKPKKIPEKEWDRLHLKLTGFLLTTHLNKKDPKVIQEIHLIGTYTIHEPEIGRFVFSVLQTSGPKKFHLFTANSEDDRNEWIQLLRDRHRFGTGELPRSLTIETHPNVVMLMNPDEKALREVAVKNAASGKSVCQNDEKNAASVFCSDCQLYLCDECETVLHLNDKKKDHVRQPLHALNSGVSEQYVVKTSKSKGIKAAVSKKKRRFVMDGFDLDLSYITDKLIAMGFPAEGTEALYRNDMGDVQKFFEQRHKDHYMVYNLCAERKFDPEKFHNRVLQFPFDDHNCPAFEDLMYFCKHLAEYLAINRKNVAAIHCKAGKGRTGLMITIFLLYIGEWQTADEALRYYGFARTLNQKGVTIPSQKRWVYYFEKFMNLSKEGSSLPPPQKMVITKMLFSATAPAFDLFAVNCHGLVATSKETHVKLTRTKSGGTEVIMGEPFVVLTDFEVVFYKGKALGGKKRAFSMWLHTQFLENNYIKLTRTEIDKVSKMKGIPDFTLELWVAPLPSEHNAKYTFGFEPISLTSTHLTSIPVPATSVFQ